MDLRPTTPDDLEEMHRIFLTAIDSVFRPHGFDPPAPPFDVFANRHLHIQSTGTSLVATEGHARLGFTAALPRGEDWFLSSLFIAPEAHGRGVGSALLEAVWGDHPRRRTITDAIQPISNSLYGRRGLIGQAPILTFTGAAIVVDTGGVEPVPADLAAIDQAAYGFDREVDHRHWGSFARRTTWPGAYSYVFPDGSIGPVGGETPSAAAVALRAELGRVHGPVTVRIPGSSRELVTVALEAGLQLAPVPGLLLCSAGVLPPTSLAIASYTLY